MPAPLHLGGLGTERGQENSMLDADADAPLMIGGAAACRLSCVCARASQRVAATARWAARVCSVPPHAGSRAIPETFSAQRGHVFAFKL